MFSTRCMWEMFNRAVAKYAAAFLCDLGASWQVIRGRFVLRDTTCQALPRSCAVGLLRVASTPSGRCGHNAPYEFELEGPLGRR